MLYTAFQQCVFRFSIGLPLGYFIIHLSTCVLCKVYYLILSNNWTVVVYDIIRTIYIRECCIIVWDWY